MIKSTKSKIPSRDLKNSNLGLLLDILTKNSGVLYNQVTFELRRFIKEKSTLPNISEATKLFTNSGYKDTNLIPFKGLLANSAIQVSKKILGNFKTVQNDIKNNGGKKWNGGVSEYPGYLPKGSRYSVIYSASGASYSKPVGGTGGVRIQKIKGKWKVGLAVPVHLQSEFGPLFFLDLPRHIWRHQKRVAEIELFKQGKDYFSIIRYESEETKLLNNQIPKVMGIDIGMSNLLTCVSENSTFIIDGKKLISKSEYFLKKISEAQKKANPHMLRVSKLNQILQMLKNDPNGLDNKVARESLILQRNQLLQRNITTSEMKKYYSKRNRYTRDYLHKSVAQILRIAQKDGVTHIIIGRNKGMKDSSDMPKKYNRMFGKIPMFEFFDYLKTECILNGIKYIETEVSYTSKCDALVGEKIQRHSKYLGERIKRGLFQSSSGKLINADVNGALNIIRKIEPLDKYKYIQDSFKRILSNGTVFRPQRIQIV